MISARVMDHRNGPSTTPMAFEPFDQALARIHDLAPVFWDRDGMQLDEHVGTIIIVGLWAPGDTPDGAHGCVVVLRSSENGGGYQIIFNGDLVWVRERDRIRTYLEMDSTRRWVIQA